MMQDEKGFTLLEILVVMSILSMLAVLSGLQMTGYLNSSKVKTAKLQLDQLQTALTVYQLDTGQYPQGDNALRALLQNENAIDGWNGPYLSKEEALKDPWGAPIRYEQDETGGYKLLSLGKDQKPGGEGDAADLTRTGS